MTLSDAEKQKIKDEEDYRASLREKQKGSSFGSLLIVGLATIALILIFLESLGKNSDLPGPRCSDATTAFVVAQDFVSKELKAPKTSEFARMGESSVNLLDSKNCKWRVLSFVDSENSFGAKIRADSQVDLSVSDSNWTLENINIISR